MKRINRFWSLILSCAFCMSLCVPSFAADKASNESLLLAESFIPTSNNNAAESSAPSDNGHLINADGTTSSTTIDDIDRIIHERNRAFLEGNTSKVNQYQQQLRNAGATPSTLSEISVSAGNVDTQSLKRTRLPMESGILLLQAAMCKQQLAALHSTLTTPVVAKKV